MMALLSSVKLKTSGGRTIEYIDHCHPNLLKYKFLTSIGFKMRRASLETRA